MSFETLSNLLAEGDWRQLIGPLLLFVFYIGASIFKAVVNRTGAAVKDDDEDEAPEPADTAEKPRYKPLSEAARAATAPQARALPYARTAASGPARVAQPAGDLTEWDRQQQIKQRRLEQIEALRRQQLLQKQQQQRQQQQRQQMHQPQQQQAARAVPSQSSPYGSRTTPSVAAIPQKTPQEALRQSRTGQPVGAPSRQGVATRQTVLGSKAAAPRAVKMPSVPAMAPGSDIGTRLRAVLGESDSLRMAIVLKEILDKPLGLRKL